MSDDRTRLLQDAAEEEETGFENITLQLMGSHSGTDTQPSPAGSSDADGGTPDFVMVQRVVIIDPQVTASVKRNNARLICQDDDEVSDAESIEVLHACSPPPQGAPVSGGAAGSTVMPGSAAVDVPASPPSAPAPGVSSSRSQLEQLYDSVAEAIVISSADESDDGVVAPVGQDMKPEVAEDHAPGASTSDGDVLIMAARVEPCRRLTEELTALQKKIRVETERYLAAVRAVAGELQALQLKINRHRTDVNISKTAGAVIAGTAGAVAIPLAFVTGGLSIIIAAGIAGGVAVAGSGVTLGAVIGDMVRNESFRKKLDVKLEDLNTRTAEITVSG